MATCGTGYSAEQAALMSRYYKRIVCFDSGTSAQNRAAELVDTLSVFPGETIKVELDAKDAASAPKKEIRLLRKLAGFA
jgi:DNA primase